MKICSPLYFKALQETSNFERFEYGWTTLGMGSLSTYPLQSKDFLYNNNSYSVIIWSDGYITIESNAKVINRFKKN